MTGANDSQINFTHLKGFKIIDSGRALHDSKYSMLNSNTLPQQDIYAENLKDLTVIGAASIENSNVPSTVNKATPNLATPIFIAT